jgi:putative endonuclease
MSVREEGIMGMYYVYVLFSHKDGRFYIGYTINVDNRVREHQNGEEKATKYRMPLKLIYYEAYTEQKDALGREKFLKSGSGHRYLKKQLKWFLENSDRGPVK